MTSRKKIFTAEMINREQQKYLRTLAHDRKVIVRIGQNGLTENVLAEINAALAHHELIKIKLPGGDRDDKNQLINEICDKTDAEKVQAIGNVLTLYKRNTGSPRITLPD